MATIAEIGGQVNTSSGTKNPTATPAVGDLILLVTLHTGNTSDSAPTDDNGSGTYTAVETRLKASSADKLKIWVRNTLIASATLTTFTHAPVGHRAGRSGSSPSRA